MNFHLIAYCTVSPRIEYNFIYNLLFIMLSNVHYFPLSNKLDSLSHKFDNFSFFFSHIPISTILKK